jgi:hypothetical protein
MHFVGLNVAHAKHQDMYVRQIFASEFPTRAIAGYIARHRSVATAERLPRVAALPVVAGLDRGAARPRTTRMVMVNM